MISPPFTRKLAGNRFLPARSLSQPLAASRASARHNGPSKLLPTHLEYSLEFDRIISNSDERGDREANGAWTPRGSTWPSIVLLTPNQIPADESQPLPSEFFRPSVKSLVMGVAVWPWNLASHHSSIVSSRKETFVLKRIHNFGLYKISQFAGGTIISTHTSTIAIDHGVRISLHPSARSAQLPVTDGSASICVGSLS
jgi:hypothetical protein